MNSQIYESICSLVQEKERVRQKELMSAHTTFRIGGPAKIFVSPGSKEELKAVVALCRRKGIPWFILGNGSNLLVSDQGYEGVVIEIGKSLGSICIKGSLLEAGAGALLSQTANKALEEGLTGLEFAAGIPGTVGGAAVMNAGAYGCEMKDVLTGVRVLTGDGTIKEVAAGSLELGYRTSSILKNGWIVLGAQFSLEKGEPEKIRARIEELAKLRRLKQPLEYPSAGSTFKRPEGFFAGKLIQDAGLKGFQVGGAQVSEKHSGFVINRDHATARDVITLCCQVSERVKEQFGVELELEIKCLGDMKRQEGR
ncbi:MAG: UDP-N-acetylmuramate dehydrogenase [Lachnospiraceae bacterium]|jgi:UDP-N-acetylmuramate dehydrogenase|nr:UDP-N-acetylmuramate dehydrogenase [Lachnospiraceae bacterium]